MHENVSIITDSAQPTLDSLKAFILKLLTLWKQQRVNTEEIGRTTRVAQLMVSAKGANALIFISKLKVFLWSDVQIETALGVVSRPVYSLLVFLVEMRGLRSSKSTSRFI